MCKKTIKVAKPVNANNVKPEKISSLNLSYIAGKVVNKLL